MSLKTIGKTKASEKESDHRASKQSKEMKEEVERNKAIRWWRKQGLTYKYIGFRFGTNGVPLSRQRIHQICSKKQPGMWRLLWKKLTR